MNDWIKIRKYTKKKKIKFFSSPFSIQAVDLLRKINVDAFKIVTKGINDLKNGKSSFLIITHYERLLNHIVPDHVHVMVDGKIIKSGDKSIAEYIEQNGYYNFS